MTGELYTVGHSAVLKEQLAELRQRATTENTAEAAILAVFKKVCEQSLTQPGQLMGSTDQCNRGSIFRKKSGRLRLFYIASSKHRQVTVLCLGHRKAGDKHDAYVDLARYLNAGRFDADFAKLGVTKPDL